MSLSHQAICEHIEKCLRDEHKLLREKFYSGDPNIHGMLIDEGANDSFRATREFDPANMEMASEVTIHETLEAFAKMMTDNSETSWAEFMELPDEKSPLRLAWDSVDEMHEVPTRGSVSYMREIIISIATYWQMLYETGAAFLLRRAAWFKEYGPEIMYEAMLDVYSAYDDRMGVGVLNGFINILMEAYRINPDLIGHKDDNGISLYFNAAVAPSNNVAATTRNIGIRLESMLFTVRMHNCLLLENMMHMPIAAGTFVMLVQRLMAIVEYWRGVITSDVVLNAESFIDAIGLGEGGFTDAYVQKLMSSNEVVKNKIMEVISES